jgi:hypothetical protein
LKFFFQQARLVRATRAQRNRRAATFHQ